MKIVITESQKLNVSYKWLKTKYPDLKIRTSGEDEMSFKIDQYVNDDGDMIFEYYPKFKKVWVSQYYVYNMLTTMFGLDWSQATEIIAKWLGEEYSIYPNRIFKYDDVNFLEE